MEHQGDMSSTEHDTVDFSVAHATTGSDIAESGVESTTESISEPTTESISEPTTDSTADPISSDSSDPIAEAASTNPPNRISSTSTITSHYHSNSSSSSISNVDALSIAPNPSFSNNFWSPDYTSGVNVIFDKLKQGCVENNEVLNMIQDRVNLENTYATALQAFQDKHKPTKKGFDKDEGASLRLAYLSYVNDIAIQGMSHSQIASDVDKTVRGPLHSFNQDHKARVDNNYSLITAKITQYHKMADQVQKLQNIYYSKCRQREDLDGAVRYDNNSSNNSITTTVASLGSELSRGLTILKRSVGTESKQQPLPTIEDQTPSFPTSTSLSSFELLPGLSYNLPQLHKIIKNLLDEVPLRDHRIAMLGIYSNVTPGDEMVRWIRKRLNLTVGMAEKFGQSLVKYGFIKPIGQVLGKFVNSHEYFYQWLPKALEGSDDSRVSSIGSNRVDSNPMITVTNVTNESPSDLRTFQLQNEIKDADNKYKTLVVELDVVRCDLEKTLVNVLAYMEQCEKERLRTVKQALKEMAHKISRPQDIDMVSKRLYLHQESINPDSDLRYLVENYKTSIFRPNVVIYKNFNDNSICQTFGVDVVNVPHVIPVFVDFLERTSDESISLWSAQSPIVDIYQLRNQINNGKAFDPDQVLPLFPLRIVISTLKQFLLEMPDSIISFTIYDKIKSIYSNEDKKNHELKIDNIAAGLSHMSKPVISQLSLLIKHLVYICKNSGPSDRNIEKLSFDIAPYLFRPRASTAFNMKDKHPGLLIKDLLNYSEEIFSSVQSRQSVKTRERSYSEANRRAIVEARNKELVAHALRQRSRPGSPLRDGNINTSASPINPKNGLLPLALSPSRQLDGTYLTNSRHRKSQSNPTRSGLQLPAVITSPRQEKELPIVPSEKMIEENESVSSIDISKTPVPLDDGNQLNDILDSYENDSPNDSNDSPDN